MIRKNFMFTEKHATALKKESDKDGVSMSEILRRALDKYFAEAK
jgi:hypothetical protein